MATAEEVPAQADEAPAAAPAATQLDDETKAKVVKQVEFYFSDSNLPKDKFLKAQVEAHPEGFVDLSLIISFKRMREFLKLGDARPEQVGDDTVLAVATALRSSEALVVGESGFQVKRATPMPSTKEAAKAVDSRSLYVRPFPMGAALDAVVDFFKAQGVAMRAVRLRRHARSKDFKGSLFLEAQDVAEAERVLGLSLVFEGAPLRMEKKQVYLARKMAERKANPSKAAGPLTLAVLEEMDSDAEAPAVAAFNAALAAEAVPPPPLQGVAEADAGRLWLADPRPRPAGGIKRRAAADPEAPGGEAGAGAADGGTGAAGGGEGGDVEMAEAAAEVAAEQYEPGCIVRLLLRGAPAAHGRALTHLIKDSLGGNEKVKFVDFIQMPAAGTQQQQQTQQQPDAAAAAAGAAAAAEAAPESAAAAAPDAAAAAGGEAGAARGEAVAAGAAAADQPAAAAGQQQQAQAQGEMVVMCRFQQPSAAAEALASPPAEVGGCPAVLSLVQGDEEEAYYRRAAQKRAAAAAAGRGSGGSRGGTRGGRGGGRGRGRGGGRDGGRGRGRGGGRGGARGGAKRGRH